MRKTIQINSSLKPIVQDIKAELHLKNESETIAYLVAIRKIYKDKITLTQHQEAMRSVEEMHNQQSL